MLSDSQFWLIRSLIHYVAIATMYTMDAQLNGQKTSVTVEPFGQEMFI